jgi:choline dehydrogenase
MSLTVIVGAGSSGAVLAARLSARAEREILLIEAGPDYLAHELPPDLHNGKHNSLRRHDWGYVHAPSLRAARAIMPRGRVVGGSSAVNTCIALRGQPEDFDEWAALGLSEWSWDQCLPAFKRLERDLDFHDDYHGTSGPLPVRRHTPSELVPVQAAFVEACRELGYPECPDSNAPGRAGVGPHAMNKLDGRRISAAEAYLTAETRARPNLTIRARTLVRRVLLRDRRVHGVEVLREDGAVETIAADEVILCAGALNTPGVLLRSGIGPAREVARLQCELVIDAPAVGHKLLDHPGSGIFALAKPGVVDRDGPLIQTVMRYPGGVLAHRADMFVQPASFAVLPGKAPLFGVVTQLGKPRGHGTLRYPDANPHSKPEIHSRFVEDAQDRKLLREGVRLCLRVLRSRAMAPLSRGTFPFAALLRSDVVLDRVLSYLCGSGYHPSGTVPMGVAPGLDAAVDAHGHVFGVHGLRVVDASVMPTIPSSNIHLPTLMLAERMAEWS